MSENVEKKEQGQRLVFVDVCRGLAILVMISIQIFDFLSVSDIYRTPPYYVHAINSVTWFPPSLLFTFVSGMSIYLLMQKRKAQSHSGNKIASETVRKYGKYILVSLPFTWFMWSISTYLQWEEAIQGIGLSAIVTVLLLLCVFRGKEIRLTKTISSLLVGAIVLCAALQTWIRPALDHSVFNSIFPQYVSLTNVAFPQLLGSVVLNALFRGWFSVVNLVPFMLGGFLFVHILKERKRASYMYLFGLAFLLTSLLLHITVSPIDYYQRSFSLAFFGIGESAIVFAFVFLGYQKLKTYHTQFVKQFINVFVVFGTAAFFVYIFHYLLILKVLQITSLKDLLPDGVAWLITIPLVSLMYGLARLYLVVKPKLPKLMQM